MAGTNRLASLVAPVHTVLRRETTDLPDMVSAPTAQPRPVGAWAFDVLDLVHHYLRVQAELVHPVIRARAFDDRAAMATLAGADAEQGALAVLVSAGQAAAIRWQGDGLDSDRQALAGTLLAVAAGLGPALDRVEGGLALLADRHLSGRQREAVVTGLRHRARRDGARLLLGAALAAGVDPGALDPGPDAGVPWGGRRRARSAYARRRPGGAA